MQMVHGTDSDVEITRKIMELGMNGKRQQKLL